MTTVNCAVYRVFYEQLIVSILKKEFDGKYPRGMPDDSPSIWDEKIPGTKQTVFKARFSGGRASKSNYFYTKYVELNPELKEKGNVDTYALYAGLNYIGFYKKKHDKAFWDKLHVKNKVEKMLAEFEVQFENLINEERERIKREQEKTKGKTEISIDVQFHKLLSVLRGEIEGLGQSQQSQLYRGLKAEILQAFEETEKVFPTLDRKRHLEVLNVFNEYKNITIEEEEAIRNFGLNEDEQSMLYEFIFDDRKNLFSRQKAVKVFTVLKGLTDQEIVRLVKFNEKEIGRTALDELPNLVSSGNNIYFLAEFVTDYALDVPDFGIGRRVCDKLLYVDFKKGLEQFARLFPAREEGIPVRIVKSLSEYFKKSPEKDYSELLPSIRQLAELCISYDRRHVQIKRHYKEVINFLQRFN